ncbi:MAG: hypothetical protein QM733_08245 [Ilumatobacteraceae bacterium]
MQLTERFGEPTDTGEQVDGSPLLTAAPGLLLWREDDRVVSVSQGPSKMTDAEIAAVASGAQRRADGALDVVDSPAGWEQIETGASLDTPGGSMWRVDYGGPRSSEADAPELMVSRVADPGQTAEAGLLDVNGAHAVDVDGRRVIVTSRPWFPRSVQVAWDDPDGWQTTLEYRPLDDLRPIADFEQTVVEIARNLQPVGTDDWSRLVDEAATNATQRNHAAWLPGVLADNELTPRGAVALGEQMTPVFVVPVARADGSTTTCEIARRQLVACHDTDTTDGAALIDPQTIRVATTDPAAAHANVISSDGGAMGLTVGPTGDGVGIVYTTVDPTRAAPDCVELRNDDDEPLRTIPISPATTCTAPP